MSFREKLLGGLTLTPAVLQEASEEVERMPEGRRKEVLKIFLGRCIRNWRREATLSRMHDNKGGPRRYTVSASPPIDKSNGDNSKRLVRPVYAYEGGKDAFPYEAAYKFRKGSLPGQREKWMSVTKKATTTTFEDFENSLEQEQKDNFYREQAKEIRKKRQQEQRRQRGQQGQQEQQE